MGKVKIWVGVSGVVSFEIKAATTLKGLCDLTGVSYSTAKSKRGLGRFMIVSGTMLDMVTWVFERVDLVKISGRGNKKGVRVGKG